MNKFVCYSCGFVDSTHHISCPNCGKDYRKPIVTVTGGICVQHISELKGRGVFATKDFYVGDLVESSPVLIIPEEECKILRRCSSAWHYLFPWLEYQTTQGRRAVAMGYGMLFNHDDDPNCVYKFNDNPVLPSIDFYAQERIYPGDEVTIYYADNLWFRKRK